MKAVHLTLLLPVLAGCSSLQFNQESRPFPENYQSEAAYAVVARSGDLSVARVSVPMPLAGATALSPQRWYSCVSGLAPPPSGPPKLVDTLDLGREPPSYHLVLVFDRASRPTVNDVLGSPLCAGVQFEPITAEPPRI